MSTTSHHCSNMDLVVGPQEAARRRSACIERNKAAEDVAAASISAALKLPDDHLLPANSADVVCIRSCSRPGVQYEVTEDSCSCTHAARGNFCKHLAKLLMLRFRINPGQLKIVMGTKLGTDAGGLDALCRQYPRQQEVGIQHSSPCMTLVGQVLLNMWYQVGRSTQRRASSRVSGFAGAGSWAHRQCG